MDIKSFGRQFLSHIFFRTYCDEYETVENMMDISAALVVTSDEASKRMDVDYVEFNFEDTTGCSLSEQFILLSTNPKYNIRLFTLCSQFVLKSLPALYKTKF